MNPILALTLHPEWAWAIAHLDKRVENRSPAFAAQIARRVGDGWLAIHAGKSIGGRPGAASMRDGLGYVERMASDCGWRCPAEDYEAGRYRLMRDPGKDVLLAPEKVATSAIVALVKIGSVLPPGVEYDWKITNSAALRLSRVLALTKPIPCKGRQGLWVPPPEIQAQLQRGVRLE